MPDTLTLPLYMRRPQFCAAFDRLKGHYNWCAGSSRDLAPALADKGAVIFLGPDRTLGDPPPGFAFPCEKLVWDSVGQCAPVYKGDVVIDPVEGRQVWPQAPDPAPLPPAPQNC